MHLERPQRGGPSILGTALPRPSQLAPRQLVTFFLVNIFFISKTVFYLCSPYEAFNEVVNLVIVCIKTVWQEVWVVISVCNKIGSSAASLVIACLRKYGSSRVWFLGTMMKLSIGLHPTLTFNVLEAVILQGTIYLVSANERCNGLSLTCWEFWFQ